MADSKGKQVVYLMIPKKVVIAAITIIAVLFIGNLASFQYTNYVARQLCGVINISDAAYKSNPNPSETVKRLAKEFDRVVKSYHC